MVLWERLEEKLILWSLKKHQNNLVAVGKHLGYQRRTLYNKVQKYPKLKEYREKEKPPEDWFGRKFNYY